MTETLHRNTSIAPGLETIQHTLPEWPQVQWLDQIDSTNAHLLLEAKTARQMQQWPRLLGAEYQSQGRGRAGRTWINKPGQTLMFSCGFLLEIPARMLAGMAPALGIAACHALRALAGPHAERLKMKWPNDIMLDDCKLAGILVESRIMGERVLIVVGMGLNLTHADDIGAQLGRHLAQWSSLPNAESDKFRLAAHVAQHWQDCLTQYNPSKLQQLVTQAQTLDYLANRAINVLQDGQVVQTGLCLGMGHDGALHLQLETGQVTSISVGDISVRPVNNPTL